MYQHSAAVACRAAYDEAAAFFAEIRHELGDKAARRGHAILYGPPPVEPPPILFIGLQPGGGEEDNQPSTGADPWPMKNEYAHGDWPLARSLRAVFPNDLYPGVLDRSLGLNAIFLRAPSKTVYERDIRHDLRARIEAFCLDQVRRLIPVLRPRRIIVIGLGTLDLFLATPGQDEQVTNAEVVEENARKRWLVSKGMIAGQPASATLHLSGARIASDDRDRITRSLRSFITGES